MSFFDELMNEERSCYPRNEIRNIPPIRYLPPPPIPSTTNIAQRKRRKRNDNVIILMRKPSNSREPRIPEVPWNSNGRLLVKKFGA